MTAQPPEATEDYSTTNRPRASGAGALPAAARALVGVGLAGCALAVVATFATVIQIRVLTVTTASYSGWDRHGVVLPLLALFGALMLAGAWRGARPAMASLAVLGIVVLLVAIVVDVPNLNDTGVWPMADQYEDARAGAGTGFYFETAAGALMLLSGGLMFLLTPRQAPTPRRRRERPRSAARRADGAGDEWFAEPPS